MGDRNEKYRAGYSNLNAAFNVPAIELLTGTTLGRAGPRPPGD